MKPNLKELFDRHSYKHTRRIGGVDTGECEVLMTFAQFEKAVSDLVPKWREVERLKIFKEVQLGFQLHSDHSAQCNGYRSLCNQIEKMESELGPPESSGEV